MRANIPVYEPFIDSNEQKNVLKCLEENWISSNGEFIQKFEESFCDYTGANYASTVSNGTVALHLALLALGIGPGDEVIVPALTYIASVNSISYVGAKPIFVDSDIDTWNMDFNKITDLITPKTKAIMAVHLYGNPCNMDSLVKICKNNNLLLIEDAAEAFGSYYKGQHVGTIGDIGTFSFFGNKTLTTGEGGMIVSREKHLIESINLLKNQGVSKQGEYFHSVIGYNYRMTNICASIGVAQIKKAEKILAKKKQLTNNYQERLTGYDIKFQIDENDSINSYWLVSILMKNEQKKDALRSFLKEKNIETRPLFPLITSNPMYINKHNYNVASTLSKRGVSLPSYPGLTDEENNYIADCIIEFLDNS
tara:strand:+ start:4017 stop:5114 length:1098 start_codon:yes stop_codon:yes gene_type:complete